MLIRTILVAALCCTTAPARAHVTLERAEASPGSSYKAVLRVPHGCSGSATLTVTVQIPEGMIAVKPMPKPGWTLAVKKGAYERSYEFMHGMTLKEGVREISWSGRLENDFYDEFVFAGFVADALAPDTTLYMPTMQECERGVARWAEIPAAGADPHALKEPAPSLRLVAGQGHGSHGGHGGHQAQPAQHAQGAQQFSQGDIVVETPWLRATPRGAKVAGGYMKITNNGKVADRLIGGTIVGAGGFEVHEMTMVNDVMRMRMLANGLEIKPGETIELKPGGLHIMGLDLAKGYSAGQTVSGTLKFEKGGEVTIKYRVAPIGSPGPAGSGGAHQH